MTNEQKIQMMIDTNNLLLPAPTTERYYILVNLLAKAILDTCELDIDTGCALLHNFHDTVCEVIHINHEHRKNCREQEATNLANSAADEVAQWAQRSGITLSDKEI